MSFLLTSLTEQMPLTRILEAMSVGLPVIASDVLESVRLLTMAKMDFSETSKHRCARDLRQRCSG